MSFPAHAESPVGFVPTLVLETPAQMALYAQKQALEAGVDPEVVLGVINCESGWNPKADGDGHTSFGLSQIHLPAHPEISREKAEDPKFAIDYLVEKLSEKKGDMWTCFRLRNSDTHELQ